MQIGNPAGAAKKPVSPAIAVAAVILVLAIVCYVGYNSLSPHQGEALQVPKTETTKWIEQKAAESHGDINQLSPEDQQKLQRLSRNQGAMMLKMLAPKK